MSERIEMRLQSLRAEAAVLEQRARAAHLTFVPAPGRHPKSTIDRTPCIKCGTRGDLGCRHRRPE